MFFDNSQIQSKCILKLSINQSRRLVEVSPKLELALTKRSMPPAQFSDITRRTVSVTMRDGVRLATDLYIPPIKQAPAIAIRTPYDRTKVVPVEIFIEFAKRGYVVVSQDCRGTGDSEPDSWDYYVYEREDSIDFVEWVSKQDWFNGFLGSFGGSYNAQTQFCMSLHPRMSAIAPEVGGLGLAFHTAHLYMFLNSYSHSVGKGEGKTPIGYEEMERRMVSETLAGGYYNEPLHWPFPEALLGRYPILRTLPFVEGQRWLWENYSVLPPKERAEIVKMALGGKGGVTSTDIEGMSSVFGIRISHDANMFPAARVSTLLQSLFAPALLLTGWYDWGADDALATWELLMRDAPEPIRSKSRIIIAPSAHNKPGYHEGKETHPELERNFRAGDNTDLLLRWYEAIRENSVDRWPRVIYYLMGENAWYTSSTWPLPNAKFVPLYLDGDGTLRAEGSKNSNPDKYTYDPNDPTPTLGGNIVSYVYTPGSVDVSGVQKRQDVLTYSTPVLDHDLDVVGPLRSILFASSSAVDTDFFARLSDVFPDGRAIQLISGLLRTRYRNPDSPELLKPGKIYELEIDMWATANRFKRGHRLRLDISSADFPKFDRNSNRGGEKGDPIPAEQTIYHDVNHPSRLLLSIVGDSSILK